MNNYVFEMKDLFILLLLLAINLIIVFSSYKYKKISTLVVFLQLVMYLLFAYDKVIFYKPDSINYYSVIFNNSFKDVIDVVFDEQFKLTLRFPAILAHLYYWILSKILFTTNPFVINYFNFTIFYYSLSLLFKIIDKRRLNNNENIVVLMMHCSSIMLYYRMILLKDTIVFCFVIFVLYMWHKKKYVLFLILSVCLLILRIYAPVAVFLFIIYFEYVSTGCEIKRNKLVVFAFTAFLCIIFMLYLYRKVDVIVWFIELIKSFLIVFLSPNIIDFQNYVQLDFIMILESILLNFLILIFFIIFIMYVLFRLKINKTYIKNNIFMIILIMSYMVIIAQEVALYGDTYVRKKLPIIFLEYSFIIYNLRFVFNKVKVWKSIKNE